MSEGHLFFEGNTMVNVGFCVVLLYVKQGIFISPLMTLDGSMCLRENIWMYTV